MRYNAAQRRLGIFVPGLVDPLPHHPLRNRAARASVTFDAVIRNYVFRNRIYRGMPTIVLLVVVGIIQFLAVYAFI